MRKRTFQAERTGSIKALWLGTSWEPSRNHKEVSKHSWCLVSKEDVVESKVGGANSCGVFEGSKDFGFFSKCDEKLPGNFEQVSDMI